MSMYINGIEVIGDRFVWDGCHKIYIIEDANDLRDCTELWGTLITGKDLFHISELENIWNKSCPLKFISNWKLDKYYINQDNNGEDFIFEYK